MISGTKPERRRLKYVATINDETLGEETDPYYELKYVDIGNVDSSGKINVITTYRFGEAPSRARRRVRDGDVIISCVRTYLQAIAAIQNPPDNLVVSTGFAVIRPRPSVMDSSFVKYALREPSFLAEVEIRSLGVSYPAITASALRDMPICVPRHQHQGHLAEYLDRQMARLDTLTAEKERVLSLLAEKRQTLISHAVMRGLDPGASLRDSELPWIGEIPDNWETRRIAWLFRERDERGDPDLPLLEVSIKYGVSVREFSGDRIETTAADFNTYKIARRGDVVFNKMRMWQGAVGVAPQDGLVSPDYVVAAPTGSLLPQYAGLLFRTDRFSAECARRSHGIVWDRLRLYWGGFRDIEVPLPPVRVQQLITDHVVEATRRIDELVGAAKAAIALLRERRAALIAAAVTGSIAVGGAP
ncbi:restriction endonuclease subunit S [Candidatus Palauibacter sp.]|uniref:restriction endonuclease subunit S n=1 Tax=Candidatus Palauibacter sp. TaxID=3101350 RepID=UPI003B025387